MPGGLIRLLRAAGEFWVTRRSSGLVRFAQSGIAVPTLALLTLLAMLLLGGAEPLLRRHFDYSETWSTLIFAGGQTLLATIFLFAWGLLVSVGRTNTQSAQHAYAPPDLLARAGDLLARHGFALGAETTCSLVALRRGVGVSTAGAESEWRAYPLELRLQVDGADGGSRLNVRATYPGLQVKGEIRRLVVATGGAVAKLDAPALAKLDAEIVIRQRGWWLGGLAARILVALVAGIALAIVVTGGISWLIGQRVVDTTLAEVDAAWLNGMVRETVRAVDRPLLREFEAATAEGEGTPGDAANLNERLQRLASLRPPGSLVLALRAARRGDAGGVFYLAPSHPLRRQLDARPDLLVDRADRFLLRIGDVLLRPIAADELKPLEARLGLAPGRLFVGLVLSPEEIARLAPRQYAGIAMYFFDQGSSVLQLEWSGPGQMPLAGPGPGKLAAAVIREESENGSELDRFFVGSVLLRDAARTSTGMTRLERRDGATWRMHYRIHREVGGWGGYAAGTREDGAAAGGWGEQVMWEAGLLALLGIVVLALLALGISIAVAGRISRPVLEVRDALRSIAEGDFSVTVPSQRNDEIGQLQRLLNYTAGELRKREAIKELFGKYLSKQVAERILADDATNGLAGVRREITVLFADVRGFTSYAERHDPEQVTNSLNEYFEVVVDVIAAHEGVLDKYIGDGLMAVFGAPMTQPDHARRAVLTAIEMQAALHALNLRRSARGDEPINIGIGVNTGPAISGNLGSIKRMEFTVIGDTVNLAARLESRAEKGQILIGAATFAQTADVVDAEPLGPIQVKGKSEAVEVWRVTRLKAFTSGPLP